MHEFPTGILTLLFNDIEGSTRLLQQPGDRYAGVLKECRRLLRMAFQQGHGYEVDTQGDAFFVVFERAADAISSAIGLQRALFTAHWPDQARVRVRVGIHTGEPRPVEEGYIGLDVHHAARIMSAAHGGQTLLSQGNLALVKNSYKIARRLLEEALAIYRERGDIQKAASTRGALAQIALAQCDFTRARVLLEENMATYSASGEQDGTAYLLCLQALLHFLSRGDSAEARTLAEQSLARYKAVGNRRFVAHVLNLLGEILLAQGGEETARARSMLEESLAIFKTMGDRSGTAGSLISLARLAASQGENEAALAAYAESWTLLRAIGAKDMAAWRSP